MSVTRTDAESRLRAAAAKRVLVIDGAMGTQIQGLRLSEAEFRGDRFKDWPRDLRGNNDLLILTRPDAILGFHLDYLRAGADIVETNTFASTAIAQADYGLEAIAYELNLEGARLARGAADIVTAETPDRPRFVAGAIGPTSRSASISPDGSNRGFRNVSFDDLVKAYGEAARGLIDGGADLILFETVFDTLNAKAGIVAVEEIFAERGVRLPLMISGTITDLSGRTRAARQVGDRAGDHQRQADTSLGEDFLDRDDAGLGVQRIEHRLEQDEIGATVDEAARRLAISLDQIVEGDVTKAAVAAVGRDRGRAA